MSNNVSLSESVVSGFTVGSVPAVTSSPSLMPSPSLSTTLGSVPSAASCTSVKPSLSVSTTSLMVGSVPAVTSSPSFVPSPSVSATLGLVPAATSSALVKPSLSLSAFGLSVVMLICSTRLLDVLLLATKVTSYTLSPLASAPDDAEGALIKLNSPVLDTANKAASAPAKL